MDMVRKGRDLLEATRHAPRMFASTREAMMCHVSSVVYVLVEDFIVIEFWKKHLGTYGNTYKTIDEPITDGWARDVIDDALRIIGEKHE